MMAMNDGFFDGYGVGERNQPLRAVSGLPFDHHLV
jgi:hypothetical protein